MMARPSHQARVFRYIPPLFLLPAFVRVALDGSHDLSACHVAVDDADVRKVVGDDVDGVEDELSGLFAPVGDGQAVFCAPS